MLTTPALKFNKELEQKKFGLLWDMTLLSRIVLNEDISLVNIETKFGVKVQIFESSTVNSV